MVDLNALSAANAKRWTNAKLTREDAGSKPDFEIAARFRHYYADDLFALRGRMVAM